MPVFGSNIATLIRGHTATVDNDGQDEEATNSDDLDNSEDKLDFSVTSNTEDVDEHDQDQEDGDPHSDVDRRMAGVVRIRPVGNGNTSSSQLEREDHQPI